MLLQGTTTSHKRDQKHCSATPDLLLRLGREFLAPNTDTSPVHQQHEVHAADGTWTTVLNYLPADLQQQPHTMRQRLIQISCRVSVLAQLQQPQRPSIAATTFLPTEPSAMATPAGTQQQLSPLCPLLLVGRGHLVSREELEDQTLTASDVVEEWSKHQRLHSHQLHQDVQ